jgi:NADH:ubiquinone oxidoreductase subunit F (NADH-binding)
MAAAKALNEMTSADIIKVMKDSGIRGRGGAGFPTGLKWEFASKCRQTRNTCCVTAMKETLGPLWTDRSWRQIRTR